MQTHLQEKRLDALEEIGQELAHKLSLKQKNDEERPKKLNQMKFCLVVQEL